jgi:hypothetical protein
VCAIIVLVCGDGAVIELELKILPHITVRICIHMPMNEVVMNELCMHIVDIFALTSPPFHLKLHICSNMCSLIIYRDCFVQKAKCVFPFIAADVEQGAEERAKRKITCDDDDYSHDFNKKHKLFFSHNENDSLSSSSSSLSSINYDDYGTDSELVAIDKQHKMSYRYVPSSVVLY